MPNIQNKVSLINIGSLALYSLHSIGHKRRQMDLLFLTFGRAMLFEDSPGNQRRKTCIISSMFYNTHTDRP